MKQVQKRLLSFWAFCLCVFCAGVWATKLGEMAGVKVPLIAMHHAYVVTERIEGIQVGPYLNSLAVVRHMLH